MAIDDLLDEHEQGERVRSWLRSNAVVMLSGVVLGLGAIYGIRYWNENQVQQKHAAHAAYERALKQAEAGTGDSAAAAFKGQEGTYATLAALRVAKAQVVAGKNDEAIATLRAVKADPALKAVVDQRLAQLLTSTGKSDEALKLLEGATDSAAQELRGDALVAAGKREEAKAEYGKALASLDIVAPARRRVELKLQDAGGQLPEPAESI